MARTKTDTNEVEQLTVRFPKGLLEALRASAEENDRSLNAEIVNAARARARAYKDTKEKGHHELVGSRDN